MKYIYIREIRNILNNDNLDYLEDNLSEEQLKNLFEIINNSNIETYDEVYREGYNNGYYDATNE